MTVTGAGFSESSPVTAFTFNGVTPSSQDCTSQTTDAYYGIFSCTFTVPDLGPGQYTVAATVNSGFAQSASTTFTITTSIAGDSPHVVNLHETAEGAILSFSPTSVAFGNDPVQTTASSPFGIVNAAVSGSRIVA